MRTFEIIIQNRFPGQWQVVAQLNEAALELPIRREAALVLDPIELVEATPVEYGTVLGRAVFSDGVRDVFKQALRSDETLHVLLSVQPDELRRQRWERLTAPIDSGWTPL